MGIRRSKGMDNRWGLEQTEQQGKKICHRQKKIEEGQRAKRGTVTLETIRDVSIQSQNQTTIRKVQNNKKIQKKTTPKEQKKKNSKGKEMVWARGRVVNTNTNENVADPGQKTGERKKTSEFAGTPQEKRKKQRGDWH